MKLSIKAYRNVCLWVSLLCFMLASCIENDIPYPKVNLQVLGLNFGGQTGAPVIDNENRTVHVRLADTVNLKQVKLLELEITQEATANVAVGEICNLSDTLKLFLKKYDTVTEWRVIADQYIERKFKVKGQVGTAQFFPDEHYASVLIPKEASLKKIELLELQLGPEGSTLNGSTALPELQWEVKRNYAQASVVLNYKSHIVDQKWTLYVFQSETSVVTQRVDAWTQVAWLYGQGTEGRHNGFEWKEEGSTEWQRMDDALVVHQGGNFFACLRHLKPQTTYVCRAFSDKEYGGEVMFTTSFAAALAGGSFDEWHKDPDKSAVWNPWAEGQEPIWDSGNDGAATLGESNTVPTDETCTGSGKAAMLQSKFVGIGGFGKFAAGNIFTGKYVRTDGTNGVLNFGIPFQERPTRLKGFFKYKTTPITYIPGKSTPEDYDRFLPYMNQPDTCAIYIALTDANEPEEIRTRPSNRRLFNPKGSHVIAYAELNCGTDVETYKPFELELKYNATDRVPKYLIVVCSASKYGDFFTGGDGTVLWVDNLTLEYDYE